MTGSRTQAWRPSTFSVAFVIFFFVLVAVPPAPAGAAFVTPEPIDENTFSAYLTWNDGVGRIVWSPNQTSVDPGGPSPVPPTLLGGIYCTAHCSEPPPFATFTSEPLESTRYINVTRMVQVIVHTQGDGSLPQNGPSNLWVRLYQDDELVGGAWATQNCSGGSSNARECIVASGSVCSWTSGCFESCKAHYTKAQWAGTTICYSLHSEVSALTKGSRLSLVVGSLKATGFKYGTKWPHASVIHIPLYSADEAAYRIPELRPVPKPSSPAGDTAFLIPALAVLGDGSRNKRYRAAACALLMAASAGCTATPPREGGDTFGGAATNTIIPGEEVGYNDTEHGKILGRVRDKYERPVPNAHVSLIGGDAFTDTGKDGRFKFEKVKPGTYQVLIQKATFKPLRTPVDVAVGDVSIVDAELEAIVTPIALGEPHTHDYWNGKNAISIFDEDLPSLCRHSAVDGLNNSMTRGTVYGTPLALAGSVGAGPDELGGETTGYQHCEKPTLLFDLPARPSSDAPNLIVPGAYDVETTVTFTGPGAPRSAFLEFRDNNRAEWQMLLPRASGQAYHIRSGWEMEDPGHQAFSGWSFRLNVWDSDWTNKTDAAYPLVGHHQNEDWVFHVAIELHRGILPLEGGHPDHWGASDTLVLQAGEAGAGARQGLETCAIQRAKGTVPIASAGLYPPRFPYPGWNQGDNVPVVPAETTWIEVQINQSRDTQPHTDWTLRFRPANEPNKGGTFYFTHTATALRNDAEGARWAVVMKTQPNDDDPIWPDAQYAKATKWNMLIELPDPYALCSDSTLESARIQYAFVAHRDAPPV